MSTYAFNRDCMEAMREFPDKFFDLAVVDPPYGGGAAGASTHTHTHTQAACVAEPQTLKDAAAAASAGCLTATISVARTGGGWDAKVRKRPRGRTFVTGMSPHRPNSLTSLRV